jgi:triphosphoribosyl-dephospho-CoA synthase
VTIASLFIEACVEELRAPKPGNVHVHAEGHRMTVADFIRSAEVSAPLLCRAGAPLGRRILDAAVATREAVGQNTNLGILLLCGPLAMAAERGGFSDTPSRPGRVAEGRASTPAPAIRGLALPKVALSPRAIRDVLSASTLDDAEAVFGAIRIANPAGLGSAQRHDVRRPASVILPRAMAEAAERDSIARQWSNGFADILGIGLRAYETAVACRGDAALAAYLAFLSAFPDSHVVRKHGASVAAAVQRRAAGLRFEFDRRAESPEMLPELLAWDAALKADGINPGTSADLSVATAFAWRLGLRSGIPDV